MKVISYSPGVTREISAVLVAAPDLPSTVDERTLVAADGYWQPGDWRADLARAVTAGHPLSAVGIRLDPGEHVTASRGWAEIARRLLFRSGWLHSPWVAVRTSPQSMVVVAASGHRMRTAELRGFADTVSRFVHRQEPATTGRRSMNVLDACHTDRGVLAVLVDHKPDLADLRFTPHPTYDEFPASRHPLPRTLYVGQHPDGYIVDLFDSGDGRGFNGEPFDLQLTDGSVRTVVGPYSSRSPIQVARFVPDVYLGEVALHDDPRRFHNTPIDGHPAILTNTTAQRALFTAARHITRTHPAALAHTSYPQPNQPPGTARAGPADHTDQTPPHIHPRRAGR
ncbi:hypothetical protein [Virgisporangium aurantiacum]|uniref:Uncharacterized protein n=1 Tax=Virgisporangium aurantiacum TaxID=175570 RepID=A0A8J4DZY4_9ACTN|nr:hypothetical protein [Virgisporangium aurantiacum]GIJ56186.1 hypothetical protein Vau01_037020 [Virgisporangium aurantiacum]